MKILVHGFKGANFFLHNDNIRINFNGDEKHTGSNIDTLKPWYSEITGLYYILHNYKDNIIGLEQYRRYFLSADAKSPLTASEILNTLKNYDIICAKEHYPNGNGAYIYCWPIRTGKKQYFEIFLDTLKKQNSKMEDYFRKYLYGQWHIQGNLVIGKREILEKYLNWFLNIMKEYNKIILLKPENHRINAYISEFFLGAWLSYYNYKLYFGKYKNKSSIID